MQQLATKCLATKLTKSKIFIKVLLRGKELAINRVTDGIDQPPDHVPLRIAMSLQNVLHIMCLSVSVLFSNVCV